MNYQCGNRGDNGWCLEDLDFCLLYQTVLSGMCSIHQGCRMPPALKTSLPARDLKREGHCLQFDHKGSELTENSLCV